MSKQKMLFEDSPLGEDDLDRFYKGYSRVHIPLYNKDS